MAKGGRCFLLECPREIRDQILGEVFFPGEKEPESFEKDELGLAPTTVRSIRPYQSNDSKHSKFEVAILRTCKQLQVEAEEILYETSCWNLMYADWGSPTLSYEFLARLAPRHRRLLRRIERKCYSEPYTHTIPLVDWTWFMTFLARECPNLRSLKLWGPGDLREGPQWVKTCTRDAEWVRAILQIEGLTYFDIPTIDKGCIYDFPEFSDEFMPWLRMEMTKRQSSRREETFSMQAPFDHYSISQSDPASGKPQRSFLSIDKSLRERIYRMMILPSNRELHPYISPWLDQTSRNISPLLRTCKQIRQEAEEVLYRDAVFCSPLGKYDGPLMRFFKGSKAKGSKCLTPRQRKLVRHVRISHDAMGIKRTLLSFIARRMRLSSLELFFARDWVDYINHRWRSDRRLDTMGAWGINELWFLARINNVDIITQPGHPDLNEECKAWLTTGLRKELLGGDWQKEGLKWLHTTEGFREAWESQLDLREQTEDEAGDPDPPHARRVRNTTQQAGSRAFVFDHRRPLRPPG